VSPEHQQIEKVISRDHKVLRIVTIAIAVIVLGLIVLGGWKQYSTFVDDQVDLHKHLVQESRMDIEQFLGDARYHLDLFVVDNLDLINKVVSQKGQQTDDYFYLARKLRSYFPEILAFTITDSKGNVLVDAADDFMGEACSMAVDNFIANDYELKQYMHMGHGAYHLDIMSPWYNNGEKAGVFFVGYKTSYLTSVLTHTRPTGMDLNMLKEVDGNSVEVFDNGNAQTSKDIYKRLSDAVNITAVSPIYDGTWKLVSSPTEGYFAAKKDRHLKVGIIEAAMLFVLGAIIYTILVGELKKRKVILGNLSESELRYRQLFDSNKAIELLVDPENGMIVDANMSASLFYGHSVNDLKKKNVSEITVLDDGEIKSHVRSALANDHSDFTTQHRLSNGEVRDVEVKCGPITISNRSLLYAIVHDVSKHVEAGKKVQYLSDYDMLTELPNRTTFLDRLETNIRELKNEEGYGAVLFLGLDNFKMLNDSMGHDSGDWLLHTVANRLKISLRTGDVVARFGGDMFIIMLRFLDDRLENAVNKSLAVAHKIQDSVAEPYVLNDQEYHITCSAGVSVYPSDDSNADDIVKHAEIAMHRAKHEGPNLVKMYLPSMQEAIDRRLKIERGLREAISAKMLSVKYQPQVNEKGEPVGAEALVRWKDSGGECISPGEFIPIAEQSAIILDIGDFVLSEARDFLLDSAEVLNNAGEFYISVNVSPRQFFEDSFVEQTIHSINSSNVKAGNIILELTEGMILLDIESAIQKMSALRDAGIRISLDDFGTGYASLSYLSSLPLDQLKIDMAFVQRMENSESDAAVVEAILNLSSKLDLKVVAEGVETLQQFEKLLELGCKYFQGFYFGRPTDENSLLQMVAI
jgi:diguanylate cyclase (GGDEF)-like protein/PAS domain S-box-containing protein